MSSRNREREKEKTREKERERPCKNVMHKKLYVKYFQINEGSLKLIKKISTDKKVFHAVRSLMIKA